MANTNLLFKTSLGELKVELFMDKSPVTAENFLEYVKEGFYDGTIFHRVIPGFVAQGGGMLPGMKEKQTRAPIKNEADNAVSNARGTLSMARTSDPHSASSQFFINLVDNARLDFQSRNAGGWGYCVFGKVTEGMDIVDRMAEAETGNRMGHSDVPVQDIVLESISII